MSLPRRSLSDAERLDWLRLLRSDNVGPVTFYELLNRFSSAAAALAALPDVARRGGGKKPLRIATKAATEAELARTVQAGARLVAWGEPDYPPNLATLPDAPPLLSLKGRADLAARRSIGIVGARNASANGRRFAREIAAQLGEAGLSVASGLARGIDTAAHEGSLAGGTIGVVAGGIDVVYPE